MISGPTRAFPLRNLRFACALVIAALCCSHSAWAVNGELDVLSGSTDLTAPGTYLQNTAPTTSKDVTFLSGTAYSPSTFTVGANTSFGSANDLTATPLIITDNSAAAILTLAAPSTSLNLVATKNGGSNADLILVSGSSSLTIQNGSATLGVALGANGNFDVLTSGTLAINSIVSGAFGLTKTGGGTLIFTGVNTFGGSGTTFIIDSGNTQFSGANGSNTSATPYTLAGGTFTIDNTTAAGGNNNNRINDTSAISFGGGTFLYRGSDAANSTETVGALNGGGGVIQIAAGGANTAVVTAASYTHVTGNGTELVNGTGLGSSTTAPSRLILTAAPALVGTTAPTNGINATAQNTQIVPFFVGEATVAMGGTGTATGLANTFVTYAATSGLRPLNPTDEFTNNAITAGNNTYITAGTVVAASAAINSLVINGGNLSVADGQTLTNTSGALLFVSSNNIAPSVSTGALGFGSTEAQVTVDAGVNGTISANITGSGGLTKSGAGTLTLSNANGYTGATTVVGGTLVGGINNALNAATALVLGDKNGNAGSLDFSNFSQNTGVASLAIATAGPAVNTITIGAGQTFSVAGNVTIGAGAVGAANSDIPTLATFTGGGTFSVARTSGTFQVGNASSTQTNAVTLDMSGLSTFNANLGATGTFRVGDNDSGENSSGNGATTVILSATSTITANLLDIGSAGGASGLNAGGTGQTLKLGSGSNTLNVNTVNLSSPGSSIADRGNGNLNFATSSGTVTIRGVAGGSTAAAFNIDVTPSTLSNNTATANFTGHGADIILSTLTIADRNSGTANAQGSSGTFSFDTGTLITGTANVGQKSGVSTSTDTGTLNIGSAAAGTSGTSTITLLRVGNATGATGGTATGIVTFAGGVNTATTINLGITAQAGVTSKGTLNLTGGSLTSNSVILASSSNATATANGTLNLTGGTLTMTGNILRGTATGTSNAALTLGGATLDLGGNNIGAAGNAVSVTFTSGTLRNVGEINGGSTPLNKTAVGILTLAGINSYSGGTTVTAGTVIVTGSLTSSTGPVQVNGGTLGGTGVISGTTTVAAAAILAPGLNPSQVAAGALTINNNVAVSGTFGIRTGVSGSPGSFDNDALAVGGGNTLTLNSAVLSLTAGPAALSAGSGSVTGGQTFTIVNGPNTGTFLNDPNGSTVFDNNGDQFVIAYNASSITLQAIPEPGSWALMIGGFGMLGCWRKMRRNAGS